MICDSKYLTVTGKVVSCAYTEGHRIHEGLLGENWFTWKTEHEIPEVKEPVIPPTPPKEPENVVPTKKRIPFIDVVDSWDLDYYEGTALMYLSRHRYINGAEDIREAIRHLELLLERKYPNAV